MRADLERERFGSGDTDWPQLRARGISFSAFGLMDDYHALCILTPTCSRRGGQKGGMDHMTGPTLLHLCWARSSCRGTGPTNDIRSGGRVRRNLKNE